MQTQSQNNNKYTKTPQKIKSQTKQQQQQNTQHNTKTIKKNSHINQHNIYIYIYIKNTQQSQHDRNKSRMITTQTLLLITTFTAPKNNTIHSNNSNRDRRSHTYTTFWATHVIVHTKCHTHLLYQHPPPHTHHTQRLEPIQHTHRQNNTCSQHRPKTHPDNTSHIKQFVIKSKQTIKHKIKTQSDTYTQETLYNLINKWKQDKHGSNKTQYYEYIYIYNHCPNKPLTHTKHTKTTHNN